MDLESMRKSYDWQEAWTYANKPQPVEGYTNVLTPVVMDDVKRIIASDDGESDGAEWIGVFELKDGRFLFLIAGCDLTGWDCQAYGQAWLADSLHQLVLFGLTAAHRIITRS